jgi:hypothetical protein
LAVLEPDCKQPRPSIPDIKSMCARIGVSPVPMQWEVLGEFLAQLRDNYNSGGAYFNAFEISPDPVFDWFASRNRLSEDGLLDSLLVHPVIRDALRCVFENAPQQIETELALYDPFNLDGALSRILYNGGAYSTHEGDGRREKEFAAEICQAMFESRFGEISCYVSHKAWSGWFKDIAWDLTLVVFDRRTRRLWTLATTDAD